MRIALARSRRSGLGTLISLLRGRRSGPGMLIAMVMGSLLALLMAAPPALARPQRVMSLDYCADQYVLALADPGQILALSKDAESERSYHAAAARGYPKTSGDAEEILLAAPDLVVRVWGGGHGSDAMIRRFGIPLLNLEFTQTLEGVRQTLSAAGKALGQEARAREIIADMERRLAVVREGWRALPPTERPAAIYLTSSGTTAGRGTLVHEMMTAAGLYNEMARQGVVGWHAADLERLVLAPPEVMVMGFHDLKLNVSDPWRMGRHASLRALLASRPTVYLDSRILACTTWSVVDGIERLYAELVAPRKLAAGRARP